MSFITSGEISMSSLRTFCSLGTSTVAMNSIVGAITTNRPTGSFSTDMISFSQFYGATLPIYKVRLNAEGAGTNGALLATWTGSSSTPNATATSPNQPTYNTPPARVTFNRASSIFMSIGSMTYTFRDGSNNPINGLTIAIVFNRSTTVGTWERLFDFGNGAAADNILIARPGASTNTTVIEIYNAGTIVLSQRVTTTDGAIQLLTVVVTNASTLSCAMWVNGVQQTPTTQNTGQTLAALTNKTITTNYIARSNWGADAYLSADIHEIIILNNVMTNDQVNYMNNGLKSKWSIA